MRDRRPVRVLVAAMAALAATLPWSATTSAAVAAKPSIELASQTPWVGRGGDFTLRLEVSAPRPRDVEIAVTLFQRLVSRSGFEQSVEGRPRGSVLSVSAPSLDELNRDAAGAFTVRMPVQDPTQSRTPGRVVLAREGVYPVKVELREAGGGRVLDGFTTHLVYIPDEVKGPELGAVLVLPVHTAPGLASDGTRRPVATKGIGALTASLTRHPREALVLAPTPETLESLASSPRPADQALVRDLVAAKHARQVLLSSYVPIDLSAMVAAGLGSEVSDQLGRGAEVLAATMRERSDPRTRLVEPGLRPAGLALLREQQVDRLVIAEDEISPAPLSVTLAQPFLLEDKGGSRPVDALAEDPQLAKRFSPDEGDVLAAHRLLADLAVIYLERPGVERVVVANAPRSWRPTTAFLDAVLDGLATSPIVEPMTLDDAFSRVPSALSGRTRKLVRTIDGTATSPAALPADELRSARRLVDSFGAIVDPDNAFFASLDRLLLIADGSGQPRSRRRAYVNGARAALTAELGRIHLPPNRSVTLTARGGEIPVTIRSELSYPIRAVLRVESDKLAFPGGDSRQLDLTLRNSTQRFRVQARTSGTFPLRIVLASTDGRLVIGKSLVTVRSTAASNVGFLLSGGAGGFLMIWWGRHIRRHRRPAAASTDPVHGE